MMRTIFAGLLAAAMALAYVATASAEAPSSKKHRQYDSLARQFPSATPRQLKNARAFEKGEYYEQDSNAHPVGSRSWWYLKEREGGGGMRF